MFSEILVGDLETNGLVPSTIHMVGLLDVHTEEYTAYVGPDEVPIGLMRMAQAKRVIGHNLRGYDIPQIERLTEGLIIFDQTRIIDTLELSRRYCTLENHKLATWGDLLGLPKLPSPPWTHVTKEMIVYCERDVRLNFEVWKILKDLAGDRGVLLG